MQAVTNIAGGERWHRATGSCAEGMLRPVDSSSLKAESPSPFETSFRSLKDELGLVLGEHYTKRQVKLVGIAYDKQRCQPFAIFYLKLEHLGFLDVLQHWTTSKDRQENKALMPVAAGTKNDSRSIAREADF